MEWVAVGLFGALVGAAELVNRYRDSPGRALRSLAALFYIALNVTASLSALALIHTFGWTFGVTGDANAAAVRWTQALVAGFGAMGLFRTSLFTLRVGDRDIGVGPASFLQIFLGAADRGVDRHSAQYRAARVSELMKDADYAKAYRALPPYCAALMQNLPTEEQDALEQALAVLDAEDVEENIKVRLLGLELINVVGEEVLENAVKSLGAEIRKQG
jgi:hypothetical protein